MSTSNKSTTACTQWMEYGIEKSYHQCESASQSQPPDAVISPDIAAIHKQEVWRYRSCHIMETS